MRPERTEIEMQPDEVSILASLFSQQSMDHSVRVSPYDIDHYSGYEADIASDDNSTLLYGDLTYEERYRRTHYSTTTLYNVPTIWQCVKKAFTLSSI
jgi:hypothetical protein